jgi:GPH family glycoside/pentoside/hexuronide:cation symporter
MIAMGIGFGGMLYFIYLLISDVIDEDELKTGKRREGTFFGITNFFMRLSMILSILTVSMIFIDSGFQEWVPPGEITQEVIFGIKSLVVIFPGIALGLSLVCLYFYPFTRDYVIKIKDELAELHKKKLNSLNN